MRQAALKKTSSLNPRIKSFLSDHNCLSACSFKRPLFTVTAGQHQITLGTHTRLMGIINMTPDSFSRDGLLQNSTINTAKAVRQGIQMAQDGADILDVGGESTRPGAKRVSIQEETARVIPTITKLAKKIDVPISIDTYKAEVARRALDAGATIVNNIMGNSTDKKLLKMVKDYNAAIVLMHIKGTPQTMQKNPKYVNLIVEIIDVLKKSIEKCLEIGIKSDKIIIDPGIGFGKNIEHNLMLINRLDTFNCLKQPLLIGTSRKSFIGNILEKNVNSRLIGTMASVSASILRGAHIVRVHDVKAGKELAVITDAIINEKYEKRDQ